MKPRWKITLPKHRHGGEPMPGSPEKRSLHPDMRHTWPMGSGDIGYRKIVSHGDPHGTTDPYSQKRNNNS